MKRGEDQKSIIKVYLDGREGLRVRLDGETVWLSQLQMAELFDKDVRTINEHIQNIFKEKELSEKGTIRKFRIVRTEGSRQVSREVEHFNLDVIISVGYRVKSSKGTQFRIWANKILKDYLLKGFVANKKLLSEYKRQLFDAQNIIHLIAEKSGFDLLRGHEKELIELISEYSKSWKVLESYDEKKIEIKKLNKQVKFEVSYDGALEIIGEMKDRLAKLRVNVYMFGTEVSHKLASLIGSLNQTFDGRDLYGSVEEKAANLLYLVIKDHPFTDGNKRIASMLFIYFLESNDFLYRPDGSQKISDNTLIALALLVATSDPKEKENIVRLIINLIQN